MEKETPPVAAPVSRTPNVLSPGTEAWSQAALNAGNRADRDPKYAKEIGKRLF